MQEALTTGADNPHRLGIRERGILQAMLIEPLLSHQPEDRDERRAWQVAYFERISGIIDAPEHEDIRALAREGKYEEAAQRVRELLG